jgi:hypothetical protein
VGAPGFRDELGRVEQEEPGKDGGRGEEELESILYGANISDLLTRATNPFLDVLAWLPYGVIHCGGARISG